MSNNIKGETRNIFIIGAKSIGHYGGYESFIGSLIELHKKIPNLHYIIITKANGEGAAYENVTQDATIARLRLPNIGHAQSIAYDIKAWRYCFKYIQKNVINKPIFYILGCRRCLSFRWVMKNAHKLGGTVYINPDGLEWKRLKWSPLVRQYLKQCEKAMINLADLIVCDSLNIKNYICKTYPKKKLQTTYIPYCADLLPSTIENNNPRFLQWLDENNLSPHDYYLTCSRFVPENNYEIIISEYMKSHSKKSLIIITTKNEKYLNKLKCTLKFENDSRIHFVDPIYDKELLKKIRENAFANIHGHMVGGTNPTLLEALASTPVNLVLDVSFNREVAENAAIYWNMELGNLSRLIESIDSMDNEKINILSKRAKAIIRSKYSQEQISSQYANLFMNGSSET